MCRNARYAIPINLARTKERLRVSFLCPIIIRISLILFNVFNMLTNPGRMFCPLDEKDTEKMEDQLIINDKVENSFESNAQPEISASCYLNSQTENSCL